MSRRNAARSRITQSFRVCPSEISDLRPQQLGVRDTQWDVPISCAYTRPSPSVNFFFTYLLARNVHQQSNGLFKLSTNSNSNIGNFDDPWGSALLAATVYHLALLTGNKTFIPKAELTRSALFATNAHPPHLHHHLSLLLIFFRTLIILLLLLCFTHANDGSGLLPIQQTHRTSRPTAGSRPWDWSSAAKIWN